MILLFELSMPGVGSWDGKWTSESNYYALTRPTRDQETIVKLLDHSFCYNFGDGWRAGVKVTAVTSAAAQKVRRRSNGFCGYDWMVTSLLKHGRILVDNPVPASTTEDDGQETKTHG